MSAPVAEGVAGGAEQPTECVSSQSDQLPQQVFADPLSAPILTPRDVTALDQLVQACQERCVFFFMLRGEGGTSRR